MRYLPRPSTIDESHVGYEVVEGLDDPTMEKKYGFIEGIDPDGKVRVKFGSGNAKKRTPDQLQFCLFQHKMGVILINPSYFREEDKDLSDEEQQKMVKKRYMDHMQGRNNEKTGKPNMTPEERAARVAEAKGEKKPAKKKRSSSKKKSTSSSKKKSVSKKKTSQSKQSNNTESSKKKKATTSTRRALLATSTPKAGI